MKIKVVGIDPSMSNFGMAQAEIDLDTMKIDVTNLILISTESDANKGVIKTIDNWRRAGECYGAMILGTTGHSIAIAEIPLMITPRPGMHPGIASLANHNAGIAIGVLSACPIPIVPVMPVDVKMAAVGSRSAAKEEMIDWAMNLYPNAPWLMRKLKGKMVPLNSNEHLADAVAVIHAGIKTREFQQATAMMRSMGKLA